MYRREQILAVIVVTIGLINADVAVTDAQCRGGERATGSSGGVSPRSRQVSPTLDAMARAQRDRYSNSTMLALSAPFATSPQPLPSNRQPATRSQAEARYQQQQTLLATRRARADSIRLARAMRAEARLRANRRSELFQDKSVTTLMIASASPGASNPIDFEVR